MGKGYKKPQVRNPKPFSGMWQKQEHTPPVDATRRREILIHGVKAIQEFDPVTSSWKLVSTSVKPLRSTAEHTMPLMQNDKPGPKKAPLKRVGRSKIIRQHPPASKKEILKAERAKAMLSLFRNEVPKWRKGMAHEAMPPDSPFMALSDPQKRTFIETLKRFDGKRIFVGHVSHHDPTKKEGK